MEESSIHYSQRQAVTRRKRREAFLSLPAAEPLVREGGGRGGWSHSSDNGGWLRRWFCWVQRKWRLRVRTPRGKVQVSYRENIIILTGVHPSSASDWLELWRRPIKRLPSSVGTTVLRSGPTPGWSRIHIRSLLHQTIRSAPLPDVDRIVSKPSERSWRFYPTSTWNTLWI